MKNHRSALTTLSLLAAGLIISLSAAAQRDGTFTNPILHADYSDPDVVRVGTDYFMTSSSFSAVPGLPILHSRDLVNWDLVNHALPRLMPEDVFAQPRHGGGVWAPAIRHHAGKYWIFYPDPDHGIYVITAADPRGRWSAPVLVKAGKGLIDPCPLWDDDGNVYLVHAFARSRAGFANILHLNRLTADALKVADAGRTIIDGNALPGYTTLEGPKFYKRNGWYYIFAPAGGVKNGWQSVFRSRHVDGPYESRIVLAQGRTDVNGPHQGALVDTPGGEWWFLHFQDAEAYGRIVHMQPVVWKDNWPVVGSDEDGDGTGEPRRQWPKPALPRSEVRVPPASDDFTTPRLGRQWQWQANPKATWWSLPGDGRGLRLNAVAGEENLWHAANLLLQKFPALEFTVTASLDATALADGERAGLIVFGGDYAWVGIERVAGATHVVMRRMSDAAKGTTEATELAAPIKHARITLRVRVTRGGHCLFAYTADGGTFIDIPRAFNAKPGRWVGAKVGVFAAAPKGETSTGYARVGSFVVSR